MKIMIADYINKFAWLIKAAELITIDEIKKIFKTLDHLLEQKKNFESIPEDPLRFSDKGLLEIDSNIKAGPGGFVFTKAKGLMEVLKNTDRVIHLASYGGNQDISTLKKLLEQNHQYWVEGINLKGKDFEQARMHMFTVLSHLLELFDQIEPTKTRINKPITMEDVELMRQKGILK